MNTQDPPFYLLIDIDKKIVVLYGDKKNGDNKNGAFVLKDHEAGFACNKDTLSCGKFSWYLRGDLLGMHEVKIENNKVYFSAQSTSSDKLESSYNLKTNTIMFGAYQLIPAVCALIR
jgi:hypothetical protein